MWLFSDLAIDEKGKQLHAGLVKIYSVNRQRKVCWDCEIFKPIVMPSAVVLLAEGAEEMEFTIAVDVLRRAEVITNDINIL